MINEEIKQAILNGAYAVSRSGIKCKYIGLTNEADYIYFFVALETTGEIQYSFKLTEEFEFFKDKKHNLDVIGLWEDKPEPFNLEKALKGNPVKLRNGSKAFILKQIKDTLIGYFDDCTPFGWELNGDADRAADSNHDIIGMWKEPEPESNTVTVTLPRALKEPKDELWFIETDEYVKSSYNRNIPLRAFESRPYFGSEQDAKAWWDAIMNSRGI